jgi:hypothetical protein
MPTSLGRPYRIEWRGKPPHMLPNDIPVWYRYLEKFGPPFINLYYDCLLGAPFLTDQEKMDPLKRDWQIILAKRADAIAELEDEVWIIEVAAHPGLRSIGQVQCYRALWLRDPKIRKIERLIIVAETMDESLLDAAGTLGIQMYFV